MKEKIPYYFICTLVFFCLLFSSCNITRNAPKGKPYLFKNTYEVNGGNFSKQERSALASRLANQIDDSSKTVTSDVLFLFSVLKSPPAYDTGYSVLSASNMKASMKHLGYYNSKVSFEADTSKSGKKVSVHYTVEVGNPTLIDTFIYRLSKPDLQELALTYQDQSLLAKKMPVTKLGIMSEQGRLVDTFRNNGYYKISTAELKLIGDTTIAALTVISDDPFEQLRLLAEAQQKIDSPEIKLAMILNLPEDTTKLNSYRINNIYVLQDYRPGDDLNDTINITQITTARFISRYHKPILKNSFLSRNISFRQGQLFRQRDYNKTLSSLSKTGVWQTSHIQVKEIPDTSLVDLIIETIPTKKFGFEASLEASYSATSNTNNALAGNLIGFSGNLSLVNRNIGREGIKMTHRLRAGIELNNNSRGTNTGLINSNEVSYSNNVLIPRNIPFLPGKKWDRTKPGESFINSSFTYNNRLRLFSLQSFNLGLGKTVPGVKNNNVRSHSWTYKILNVEFSYLFNQTDSFKNILASNPFLNYSYNTAFVLGIGAGYNHIYRNPAHPNSLSRERSFKANIEESGLTWGALPILNNYKKKFIKLDAEYKYSITYPKTALVLRTYAGVGIPLFKDSSLPFFKQFIGGGTNSMRGWPIRGIGRGGQLLAPYKQNIFNDRTGDMQIELNGEFRYDIAPIIPNLLTLRGAIFVDIGNIWNIKNSKTDGTRDSAQFKFENLYKEIGMSAGTGFRLDFSYVVLRFDLGFRFKRPELSHINNGWKAPPIGFDDFLGKIFSRGKNDEYRKWRYENFNFTIGISYPF